jgi:hypothetical protein
MEILVIVKGGRLGKMLFKHFEQFDIQVIGTTLKALDEQIFTPQCRRFFASARWARCSNYLCWSNHLNEIRSNVSDSYLIYINQT